MAITSSPNIVSQSREDERDGSIVKLAVLGVIELTFSFAAFSVFFRFLETAQFGFLYAALGFVFGAVGVLLLNAVFIKNEFVAGAFALVAGLLPLLVFLNHWPSSLLIGTSVLLGLLLASVSMRGVRILKQLSSVRFFHVSHSVVPRAITAFFLFFSVLLYLAYFEWGVFTAPVGKTFVEGVVRIAAPVIRIRVPSFSERAPLRETISEFARGELQRAPLTLEVPVSSGFSGSFGELPPSVQGQIVNRAAAELEKALEGAVGVPVPFDASFSDATYAVLDARLAEWSPRGKAMLGAIAALSLFSILKGISLLLSWLVSLFAFLVYKFLVSVGFAHTSEELRNREFVILS